MWFEKNSLDNDNKDNEDAYLIKEEDYLNLIIKSGDQICILGYV